MILHPIAEWLRPERIVVSTNLPITKSPGRIAFNEQDERWYVYERRWRWSRR